MNWDEITRSDQYQQADDYHKEVMRNHFMQQTVDQYGWNEEQASVFRKKALEAADNVTDATQAATRLAKLDKNIGRASVTIY